MNVEVAQHYVHQGVQQHQIDPWDTPEYPRTGIHIPNGNIRTGIVAGVSRGTLLGLEGQKSPRILNPWDTTEPPNTYPQCQYQDREKCRLPYRVTQRIMGGTGVYYR